MREEITVRGWHGGVRTKPPAVTTTRAMQEAGGGGELKVGDRRPSGFCSSFAFCFWKGKRMVIKITEMTSNI